MEQGTLKVRVADAGPQSRWCKPYLLHVNGLICAKLIQWRRRRNRRSRLRGPSLRLRRTHLTLFRIQTPSVTIDQGEVPSAVSAWERMGPRFVSDSDSTRRRLSCGGRRNRLRVDEKATSAGIGHRQGINMLYVEVPAKKYRTATPAVVLSMAVPKHLGVQTSAEPAGMEACVLH